eukprot:8610825-Pyramimonas_sp.AAC.1
MPHQRSPSDPSYVMKDVLEATEGALIGDLLGDRPKTAPIAPKTVPWRSPLRAFRSVVVRIALA